jgi:hypothetical protein
MLRTLFGHPAVKFIEDADQPKSEWGTLDDITRESTSRQIKALREIADSCQGRTESTSEAGAKMHQFKGRWEW